MKDSVLLKVFVLAALVVANCESRRVKRQDLIPFPRVGKRGRLADETPIYKNLGIEMEYPGVMQEPLFARDDVQGSLSGFRVLVQDGQGAPLVVIPGLMPVSRDDVSGKGGPWILPLPYDLEPARRAMSGPDLPFENPKDDDLVAIPLAIPDSPSLLTVKRSHLQRRQELQPQEQRHSITHRSSASTQQSHNSKTRHRPRQRRIHEGPRDTLPYSSVLLQRLLQHLKLSPEDMEA